MNKLSLRYKAFTMSDDTENYGEDENSSCSDESIPSESGNHNCVKLNVPWHLSMYTDDQDTEVDEETRKCDKNLVEKVVSNYIIVKRILSSLSWQDKLRCKQVNTTWHSAVQALQKEQIGPVDFSLNHNGKKILYYNRSNGFYTEPMVVLTFANIDGFDLSYKCKLLSPQCCTPPCDKEHCLLDYVHQDTCGLRDRMLAVRANYISYLPLPPSPTYENVIKHVFVYPHPFIGGVYIPSIPDVNYQMLNIKCHNSMQQEFFDVVDKIVQDNIIKGVLVFVSEKYLLHSVECIVFLNYFQEVQPDIPYALGGCIVEDILSERNNLFDVIGCINNTKDFISENLITLGIFSVPKNPVQKETIEKYNFDMYSLVVESSDWTKAKIQKTISDFSKNVPRYEHSVVLKLSCVGREQKHALEQDTFRNEFPDTRLIGCYGNGELGLNHPSKPSQDRGPPVKRHRLDPGPQFGIMFSYSTVFMYMGWGKKTVV